MLLIAFQAVAVAWGIGHAHGGAAFDRAEQLRHAALAATPDGHGHTHDDGGPAEQVPGHLHGHNAFDHSHETPSVTAGFGVATPAFFQTWNPDAGFSALARPPDPIERPPRYA